MSAHHRLVVLRDIPGHDVDPGQVIPETRAKEKHVALRLTEFFVRGHHQEHPCVCGAVFISADALATHTTRRHPAPPPKKIKPSLPPAGESIMPPAGESLPTYPDLATPEPPAAVLEENP